jgi:thiol-disulfide isomerase/thioredoxin
MEIIRDGFDWEGRRFMRELPPDSFRLARRASAEPFTPSSRTTRLKPGLTSFTFSGVTPDGDTLTDKSERFRGKALIVDIMGTWCHNCLDAAPVLQRLYEEFGPRGLEVVSLAFELTDDPVTASKNLRLFADRHGVTYPLLFTGDLSSENVRSRIGSQLEHFGAYPTTLFIDRSGDGGRFPT